MFNLKEEFKEEGNNKPLPIHEWFPYIDPVLLYSCYDAARLECDSAHGYKKIFFTKPPEEQIQLTMNVLNDRLRSGLKSVYGQHSLDDWEYEYNDMDEETKRHFSSDLSNVPPPK